MVSVFSTYNNNYNSNNNNNNDLHLYSANLYMNIFGCALQYVKGDSWFIQNFLGKNRGLFKDFPRAKIIFSRTSFPK